LPDGQATISAGVTTHDGRTVREVDLPPARRSSGGPDGAEMLATVFSTAELGRGRYRLVLTIVDPAGRRLETRSVPFDIVDS
jgi:hypothetical protein